MKDDFISRFCELPRGVVGRAALGFLSILLLPVALFVVVISVIETPQQDAQEVAIKLVLGECGLLLALVTAGGMIWTAAMPSWLEKPLSAVAVKLLVLMLALPWVVYAVRQLL